MNFPLTERALKDLGELFTEQLKNKIAAKIYPYGHPDIKGVGNKIASGDLYNSIRYNVIKQDEDYVLEISYSDYFQYVNRGRRMGVKRVPIKALLDWIKIKKLKGRDKKGRFIKNLSLAFAIQQNIYKFGIRPTNIYDKALDSLEDIFDNPPAAIRDQLNELYEMMEQDINNLLEQTIETIK